jgi:hypothetical protein
VEWKADTANGYLENFPNEEELRLKKVVIFVSPNTAPVHLGAIETFKKKM